MGVSGNDKSVRRLGVYCRVSSKKQMDNLSLDNQKERGIRYCDDNGYLYEVYSDVISGSKVLRVGLDELFQKIYDGRLDGIVLYELDRLQRDNKELLIEFEKLIEDTNCLVVVNSKILDINDNISDRIDYELKNTMSTIERMRLKKRVGEGIQRMMERGNTLFGKVKFGYKNVGKKHTLHTVINEETSVIVEEIFRVFNLPSIQKFDDLRLIINKRFNTEYQSSFLIKCLKYDGYMGTTYQKWGKPSKEHKITIPSIVSKDVWNKTQIKLKQIQNIRVGRDKVEHLLKGLVNCKSCDDKLYSFGTTNHTTKQYWYKCKWGSRPQYEKNRRLYDEGKQCTEYRGNYINRYLMEIVVWDGLFEILKKSKIIREKYEKKFNKQKQLKDSNKHSKQYHENKVESVNSKKFRLYDDYLSEKIRKKDYDLYTKKYDEEIVGYEKRISELDSKINIFKSEDKLDFNYVEDMMKKDLELQYKTESFKDKRRFIDKYINKIYLKRLDNEEYLLNFDMKIVTENNECRFSNTYIKKRILYHSNSYIGTLELNTNIIFKKIISKYSNTTYLYSYKISKLEVDII